MKIDKNKKDKIVKVDRVVYTITDNGMIIKK